MPTKNYSYNVFINCPFDRRYQPIFRALIFAVIDCGFTPRSAMEIDDSTEERLTKIFRLIEDCKYGIHDISRTQLDPTNRLPRFNMSFELGLFLAAQRYGKAHHKKKTSLILDTDKYRYQKFLSDISGRDIQGHNNKADSAISIIRNWLASSVRVLIPHGNKMSQKYKSFRAQLPRQCAELELEMSDLTFVDYTIMAESWLKKYQIECNDSGQTQA